MFCLIINPCPISFNEKIHVTKPGAKVFKAVCVARHAIFFLVWFRDHNAGKIKTLFFYESKKSPEASA